MELLSPSPPPQAIGDCFAGLVSPVSSNLDLKIFDLRRNHLMDSSSTTSSSSVPYSSRIARPSQQGITEVNGSGDDDKVYIAVGNSIDRTIALLHWTFRRFRNREICLVHVYQPSSTIPTLCKFFFFFFFLFFYLF